jgi:PAS domain S-box-containing protein
MAPDAAEPSRKTGQPSDVCRQGDGGTGLDGEDRTGDPAAMAYPIEPSFRHFAESLSDLVWSARPDGDTDYYNRRFLDYLGRNPDEMGGWTWTETLHPDDADRARRAWERAFTTGSEYEIEFRIRRHDGIYRWHRSHGSPMRDGDGRITRWFGTCTDIDDRRRADEALRGSEERFARFMRHVPGPAWIKDSQGRYIYANDDAQRAFGVTPEVLYGRTDEEVFPPETAAEFRGHDRRVLETGTGIRVLETLEHEDGTVHQSLVSKFPIPSPDGADVLVGGMAIDITDRLEMEAALKEADRRKDEFLATLAHELRNPLAAIRNGLEILRLAAADPHVIDEIRTLIDRQVSHMVRLIDDLMDVSRISRGKLELRRERVELAAVVEAALETSRPLIEASRHEFAVTLPARPIYVDADVTRLSQVFSNLLNNAAKYTEPGGFISLTVERRGSEAVVSVRDDGVGIPPEMLPRVFDLFTQVDRTRERSQGGLGIGLTLVKRLVGMHGGSVEARSGGRGLGSEFVVRLPMSAAPPAEATIVAGDARMADPAAGRRILVVDDREDSAQTLARFVTMIGHEARTASDGGEAVAAAEEYRPEVILLDIGLPVMNGYDVARAVRARAWGRDILIVALTGWGQDGDRRQSKEAGIDHHLVKPVDLQALQDLLFRLDQGDPT